MDNNRIISDFREEKFKRYDALSLPKWKRLRVKEIPLPEYKDYNKEFLSFNKKDLSNIKVRSILDDINSFEGLKDYLYIKEKFGVDEKLVTLSESLYNSGVVAYASNGNKNKAYIYVRYDMDKDNPVVLDHNIIVTKENSEVNILFDYASNSDTKVFHNGVTKVFAERGSVVNIIKIQRLSDISINLDSNIAKIEGNGKVNWISVDFGSEINGTNYITNLNGDTSESNLSSVYIGDGDRKMDLGYSMVHRGRRSISNIETRGVLKDNARKVFRGNLDFKKGSTRSKGVEEEYVILLDKTVKADAIPALLCEEDDVEGEHAASAGQVDENKLFYMMSRGLTEKEAKKLIIKGSFKPIVDRVNIEEFHNIINNEIDRRIIND